MAKPKGKSFFKTMKRSLFMLFIFASALMIAAGTKAGVTEKPTSVKVSTSPDYQFHALYDFIAVMPLELVDITTCFPRHVQVLFVPQTRTVPTACRGPTVDRQDFSDDNMVKLI